MPAAPERAVREERTFRLQRSRDLYPDFISENMRERWTRHDDSAFASALSDTAFVRAAPGYVDPSSRSSGGGGGGGGYSSRSFGGGSSGGGGGAGGSW